VAALIKDCRYTTARGCARRAAPSTTVIFLELVIYFGRAFPNWRARVIPAIAISGFLAFVSKNSTAFRRGGMSLVDDRAVIRLSRRVLTEIIVRHYYDLILFAFITITICYKATYFAYYFFLILINVFYVFDFILF